MSSLMKSMIIVPIFFLAMLVALIVYDSIEAVRTKNVVLLREDRIHFHNIIAKVNTTNFPLNIDSFHYVVFVQSNNHESRTEMMSEMDSLITVFADKVQILP